MPNNLRPPIVARECSLTRSLACTHSAFPVTTMFHSIFGVSLHSAKIPWRLAHTHAQTINKLARPTFWTIFAHRDTQATTYMHENTHAHTQTYTRHAHTHTHTHTIHIHTRLRKAIATRANSCSDHLCSATTLRHTPISNNLHILHAPVDLFCTLTFV